ncbi:MAG: sensor histidine kinase [Candidatus Falkowbacteria bacterium]
MLGAKSIIRLLGKKLANLNLRYIIFIPLLALLVAIVLGYLQFSSSHSLLEKNSFSNVSTIADYKENSIKEYLNDRKASLLVAESFFDIKTNLPVLSKYVSQPNNIKYKAAVAKLDSQLVPFMRVYGYEDVLLVGLDDKVLYSANKNYGAKIGQPLRDLTNELLNVARTGTFVSGIFPFSADPSKYEIMIAGPATDLAGKLSGIIVYEVSMNDIFGIAEDTTGLGKTGETVLGIYEHNLPYKFKAGVNENRIIFLNALRQDSNAAFNRYIEMGDKNGVPLQKAVDGQDGQGASIDYRGVSVISAWRYLEDLKIGLVAKVDTSEAFAPVDSMRNQTIIVMIVASIIILFLSILLAISYVKSQDDAKKILDLNGVLKLLNQILRHDILNDLTVVKVYLDVLNTDSVVVAKKDQVAAIVQRSINLVDEMRNLESAVSIGQALMAIDVKGVVEMIKKETSDINITLKGQAWVLADQALKSVITNLVRNAKLHGLADQAVITIKTIGRIVEIRVADNGQGIPNEIKPQLFAEGFKYGATGHTGIGLYICKKTVDRYGGKIWIENNQPKGAVFVMQLALADKPVIQKIVNKK